MNRFTPPENLFSDLSSGRLLALTGTLISDAQVITSEHRDLSGKPEGRHSHINIILEFGNLAFETSGHRD
jgi:hypothetical protein